MGEKAIVFAWFSPLSFPINIKYNFKIKKYFDSKTYIF